MYARQHGIDRVAAQSRQDEAAVNAGLKQRVVAGVGGAATPGNESGAKQLAPAGQIHHGARLHQQRPTAQDHAGFQLAEGHPALAEPCHCLAVVGVDLTIERAAVRHRQALAAHRCQTAGQQFDVAGAEGADLDHSQWRAHHPALRDVRAGQLQAAEGGVRHYCVAIAVAPDGQRARPVVVVEVVGHTVQVARQHPGTDGRRRIQLRRPQGQVALGHQLGADARGDRVRAGTGEETQVARAAQLHAVVTATLDAHRTAIGLRQVALGTEQHIAAHIDQIAAGLEYRLGLPLRHRWYLQHRAQPWVAVGFRRGKNARQQQMRRGEPDPRIDRGCFAQVEGAAVQAQALAHVQRHIAVKAQQAVTQQGQVVETACADLVHPEQAVAVFEAGGSCIGRVREHAALAHLAELQFAHFGDAVGNRRPDVVRAFQGHGQAAAGSTGAPGPAREAAVQVQAIVGRQTDAAAVAGHLHPALARNVQRRVGAGSVEACALAHHHEQVASAGNAAHRIDPATDDDGAAVADLAIAAAPVVQRAHGARRHIDQRLISDPDRAAVADRLVRLGTGCRQVPQRHAAAPRMERAVHRELADTAHIDGLAGIDTEHSTFSDHSLHRLQFIGRRAGRTGLQREARTLALREQGLDSVFLVQRRRPQFQRVGRFAASDGVLRVRAEAGHRHPHVDLRALGHSKVMVADERIASEAFVEEIRAEHQRVGQRRTRGIADGDAPRLQRERAAAVHAMAEQHGATEPHLAIAGIEAVRFEGDAAAFASLLLRIGQQCRAGRHVERTAFAQHHVASTAQQYLAAVTERQSAGVGQILQLVGPPAAGVHLDAFGHGDTGVHASWSVQAHVFDTRVAADLLEHIAQPDGAAVRGQVGSHIHDRSVQHDLATRPNLQIAIDLDLALGRDLDGSHRVAIELRRVEHQRALPLRREGCCEVQFRRNALLRVLELNLIHDCTHTVVQQTSALVEHRQVLPDDELAASRHCVVRLVVAVQFSLGSLCLAHALESYTADVAFEHGGVGGDHQRAGIAPHRVAVFQLSLRCDQWVVEMLRDLPALVVRLVALVDAFVEQITGRLVHVIQPPIAPLEPGLIDETALHIQRAAREVDAGAGLRDHIVAAEAQRAALRHPFAHSMPRRTQIPAHFEQAAGGVPAVGGVAVRALGYEHQAAAVDPHVVAAEGLAIPVERRIALFVALDVDLDVVRFHGQVHAHGAGDVDPGALTHQAALGCMDVDLTAGGQGQGVALEVHRAATCDLDARLVAAIRDGHDVLGSRDGRSPQAIALAVQGSALAVVLDHHGGSGTLAKGDLAVRADGVQVHGAAGVDAGRGEYDTVLLDVTPQHRHVALASLDQAGVADLARQAVAAELWGDLVAACGRRLVAVGADALPDDEAVAGRERGLAFLRGDVPRVVHLLAEQQDVAAAFGGSLRGQRGDPRAGLNLYLALGVGEARFAGVGRVDAAGLELGVADPGGGSDEIARVDLATAIEDDAVAVDDEHRAIGLDLALDLRGACLRIVDAVENGPILLLPEFDRGIAPDIEGLPVQDGLVAGLRNGDVAAAVDLSKLRGIGVVPARRQRVGVDFQATRAHAVGDRCAIRGRQAGGGLGRLLRRDAARGQVQIADRALQLLVGLLLLSERVRQARCRLAAGQPARLRRRVPERTLVGKPCRTERALRMGRQRYRACDQCQRDGPRQRCQPEYPILFAYRLIFPATAPACVHVSFRLVIESMPFG